MKDDSQAILPRSDLNGGGQGLEWLSEAGEMAAQIRAVNWSNTPLGPVSNWSPALKMMVQFLLANRFPLLLWWGPKYVSIYNDAYRPILGAKHPQALGQPVSECWSEIWNVLRPLIDTPFHGGPATWNDDILLEINRHGFAEETHFTIAYSPVPDESVSGGIGGVLATVHEITDKIVAERRGVALRDLGTGLLPSKTAEEACAMAAEALAKHTKDVPFALLYLTGADGSQAQLAGSFGVQDNTDICPRSIDLRATSSAGWEVGDDLFGGKVRTVSALSKRFSSVPAGPWSDPPSSAAVLTIPSNKLDQPAGLLIVGLSARLKFDDYYRDFLELVRSQIAMAVGNARAYEADRRRAEALADLDRAKTVFFSNISHEFRTPLTLMLGPLEEMRARANLEPALVENGEIDLVLRNSRRLLKLVNTLLDFSRIEAGRVKAEFAETDLAGLTTDLASVFQSAMTKAGIKFSIDCPPLPEAVFVDADLWEKIVFNLLSNALKYTLAGEVRVTLRAEGGGAVLVVQDTGLGIAPNELPNLFKRFHRIESARGRTNEGTGIGLALVHELVKLHGGTISVKSEFGRGSEFSVRIPFGKTHFLPEQVVPAITPPLALQGNAFVEEALGWTSETANSDARHVEPEFLSAPADSLSPFSSSQSYPRNQPNRPKILLAEDNADMREYVSRLLSDRYVVKAVADGAAAFEAVRTFSPDLLLSDVMMPEMNGFELAQRLRNDDELKTLPIILLSARAGEEARVEGASHMVDDYLTKPFSARELFARVALHLELARVRREVGAHQTFLLKLGDELRYLADPTEIQVVASRVLGESLKGNRVAYFEIDGTDYVVQRDYTNGVRELRGRYPIVSFGEHLPALYRKGYTTVSRDVATDDALPQSDKTAHLEIEIAAFIGVPLIKNGQFVGGLTVHESKARNWTASEIALVEQTAERTWAAVERARAEVLLRESETRLASEAQALLSLNAVSSRLWQANDLAGGLREMLHATIQMLGADMGNVQVINAKGVLVIAAQHGFKEDFLNVFREVATDKDCACGRALRSGDRILIDDVETDAPYEPFRAIARSAGYRAVQSTPLLSRNGTPLGMISTHWRAPGTPNVHDLRRLDLYARQAADFIERFRNDEVLSQTRQRFDIVRENTQVGFWFCDLPFDKLDWDVRVKEHFWLSPDADVTIHTFYERMHPDDREPTRRAMEVSIAQKTPYVTDYRTLSEDGQVKWIRAIGRGYYDADGQATRFDGVTLDITERKRAETLLRDSEAQLREGRERLQAALNGSGTGTFRWNIQTNALDWDENLDRLFGLPPGKTIRSLQNFIAVVHPDERLGVIERCNRCAQEGADFDMEFRIIWPDGTVHWLDDKGSTFRDTNGRPLYMTGMCLDITKRKEVEEALRMAKEKAEAANRSKDDFLAALSHELRTPLTPVLMTAAALKDDLRLPNDIREQLGMMERNVALEARLIDDLLDLTAISHGKLKMRLEECDLNTLVDRVVEMVAQDANAKNLIIEREFRALSRVLQVDFTRFQQVVWNLLRNAVKFSNDGGKITIRTRETFPVDGSSWVTLEICDTGMGIEPANLDRIFQPFDQGGLSGNHRFGGLGLGLAIAHAVVVAHGGRLAAQSAGSGLGATFVVELPLTQTAAHKIKESPPSPMQSNGKHPTSKRILLVEDHESTLQTLSKLLQRDGHQISTATSIAGAQAIATQKTFDLVISDLGLPDGKGTALMDKLRSTYGLRGIALSGYGMEEDLARSKAAGFFTHLVKPIVISDLRRAIDEIPAK